MKDPYDQRDNGKHTKTSCQLRQANAWLAMLSCGGRGLSSFSDPRGFQTFAESELVFCRPAASAAAGGEERSAIRSKTSRSSTMVFPMRPACVDHGACSIASRRLVIPCWPDRPAPPACSYWIPRHSLPASSGRCLTGDGEQQWWRSYVLVRSDRSPDCCRKASWFPAVQRPRLATKEFRPFVPKHQARRHYDGIHSRCVCPPNTMNTVNSASASQSLLAPIQVLLIQRGQHSAAASPDRANHVQKKNRWFEGLAAKPKSTAQNYQIHTSRLPRMIRNHMYTRLYQAPCRLCLTTSLLATDGISHEGPRFFTLVQPWRTSISYLGHCRKVLHI